MKIGSKVKLKTPDFEADAFITGEDVDSRSPDRWLVTCHEKGIIDMVFYKDAENGKHYAFGNFNVWIMRSP